jgi:hypothetical protein
MKAFESISNVESDITKESDLIKRIMRAKERLVTFSASSSTTGTTKDKKGKAESNGVDTVKDGNL